jgi:hypothetical protein
MAMDRHVLRDARSHLVPSEAEHCRTQAAEFRRRAEQTADVSIRKLLELARAMLGLRGLFAPQSAAKRMCSEGRDHHDATSVAYFKSLRCCRSCRCG